MAEDRHHKEIISYLAWSAQFVLEKNTPLPSEASQLMWLEQASYSMKQVVYSRAYPSAPLVVVGAYSVLHQPIRVGVKLYGHDWATTRWIPHGQLTPFRRIPVE